jgi:hypothetical protein
LPKQLLDDADVLYNYGVGNEISFEEEFLTHYPGKTVRAFDHTIEQLPVTALPINFYKEGLGACQCCDCDSFENHVRKYGDTEKKILLKIDVEGSEYEYFSSKNSQILKNNVYGIILEIHQIDSHQQELLTILGNIAEDFACVHLHNNNCGEMCVLDGYLIASVIEISWVNKKLYQLVEAKKVFFPKVEVDVKCNNQRPDFPINFHLDKAENNALISSIAVAEFYRIMESINHYENYIQQLTAKIDSFNKMSNVSGLLKIRDIFFPNGSIRYREAKRVKYFITILINYIRIAIKFGLRRRSENNKKLFKVNIRSLPVSEQFNKIVSFAKNNKEFISLARKNRDLHSNDSEYPQSFAKTKFWLNKISKIPFFGRYGLKIVMKFKQSEIALKILKKLEG